MMHMQVLRTTADVIDALGNNVQTAKLLGVKYNTVTNWRTFGHFPPDTYVMMQRELELRDFIAPPELWKMRVRGKPRKTRRKTRAEKA
jgi:hypothetical protein